MPDIRALTFDDMPEILSRVRDAGHESGWIGPLKLDLDYTAQKLAYMIESENYLVIGSEDVGAILIAHIGSSWFSPTLQASELIVYAHPEVRKRGIARELVTHYIQWARDKGVAPENIKIGVSMEINPDQVSKLYESIGFKKTGYVFTYNERN